MFNIFGGLILIAWSIATYVSGTFSPYWNYDIDLGLFKYPLSIISFAYGIDLIINYKYIKSYEEKYTICPKCKESFNYNDLKNGKCLYCENIDTIDIEEYYDDHKP
jgi:hypothetical protein